MVAAVESMVYFGETPWHGEGEKLTGNETVNELIVKAGLDWKVETEPLFRLTPELLEAIRSNPDGNFDKFAYKMGRASVRSDNSDLGCVGPRWTPLQNREAFEIFEPLVESGDMAWHTAGSLKNGQRVWVLCQLNMDPQEIVPGDEVRGFGLLSNGHDGKLAVHFGFTPIRVVCANTEALARESKLSKLIRVVHHKNVKRNLEALRDTMNLAKQEFEATAEQYQWLASRPINKKDLEKYVRILHGVEKKEDDEIPTRTKNLMNRFVEVFETGRGADIPGVKGTWWGAFNTASELAAWEKGRTVKGRIDSNWFGPNAAWRQKAYETALVMAS